MVDYLRINQANWDARVPVHLDSDFYDVAGFKAGGSALRPFELAEVGDVAGRSLAHLQCHLGLDTLSWARLGAEVTGLDFSGAAIEQARSIAAECGLPARFVTADVYDAPRALGETYDIVYTGVGALVWLPDLTRWAEAVAALLNPGGFLYLAEFHPFTNVLDDDTGATVYSRLLRPHAPGLGLPLQLHRQPDPRTPDLRAVRARPRRRRQRHRRGRPAPGVPARARSHAVPPLHGPGGGGRRLPAARRRSEDPPHVLPAGFRQVGTRDRAVRGG